MTTDDPLDRLGKDLTFTDPQQQQKKQPFQVVLVDIEKAAKDKVIQCVKKPLEAPDLKFVAVSYRWGELHETLIDTKVGYTASITSFALNDFYQLCKMMTMELDLKHIKYVWVDAICVDQRPSKRKAIIYRMNNIYERATYILAVPDLHLTYLKGVSIKNKETIVGSYEYTADIYHLIHGNTTKLAAVEKRFLNDFGVPYDPPELRPLLLRYTDYFAHSFMNFENHQSMYCPVRALDHIFDQAPPSEPLCYRNDGRKTTVETLHQCREKLCPLALYSQKDCSASRLQIWCSDHSHWKSKTIERGNKIRQSMDFLTDLIKDWSSRVWVISEFNIAKKANNLKYWFIQLARNYRHMEAEDNVMNDELLFFKFDFTPSSFFLTTMMNIPYYANQKETEATRLHSTDPIYLRFHSTMVRQLHQRSFLEMILSSKASKNKDRFYSILPLSAYQSKKWEMSHWKIRNTTSVKLKLYDFMNIKDKLVLLFWSIRKDAIQNDVLPTFATSTLPLDGFQMEQFADCLERGSCNFDLDDPSTIRLHHQQHPPNNDNEDKDDNAIDGEDDDDSKKYHLRIKLKEYYVAEDDDFPASRAELLSESVYLCKRIGIKDASAHTLDIVFIPAFQLQHLKEMSIKNTEWHYFTLVGCFVANRWIIFSQPHYGPNYKKLWAGHDGHSAHLNHPATVFDIY